MAPFGLMFSGVCLLKKSFSLFSHASSLTRPPVWTGAGACWTVNSSRFVNVIPAVKSLTTIAGAPPKRPLNGYMRFVKQQQPLVVREYPDVKAVDVIRKIAQQWRTLTADQKQPFQQASVVAREQFKVDMQRYQSQLTPAQAAALKQERRLRLAKRKAIRRKRELNSLGKPKRPRSSFNIFMAEHFEESRGTTTQGKMKMLREDWTKLSTSQKQVGGMKCLIQCIRYVSLRISLYFPPFIFALIMTAATTMLHRSDGARFPPDVMLPPPCFTVVMVPGFLQT
uniref:Transcription factor A, mitochondrial n=1 Tax=Oncorhynchus kisutch TaxID=8019 RepID=A0A8C7HMI8_ONCKI